MGGAAARLDVPHTSFAKLTEVHEQPHLKAVGMFVDLEHPTEGTMRQARPFARFSDDPTSIHLMPPRLGEHTQAILQEAGYSDAEIASLVEKKAVGMPS